MKQNKHQPNVLFLLSDEHSFRGLSCLDGAVGEPVRTPTLDGLAKQGVRFSQTYCQVPLCTPSRICMLTGKYPMTSGGWNNGYYLRPKKTVATMFRDAGYETCLVGKMHLGGDRQFVGFNHRPYGDITGKAGHQQDPLDMKGLGDMRGRTLGAGVTQIPESLLQEQCVARETVAFLREHRHANPDQPWFLCASFSRPHFPLTAPKRYFDRYWLNGVTEPKVGRTGDTANHPMTKGMARGFRTEKIDHEEMLRARAAYFACIDYLDEIVGDLLATLKRDGLLENTIIVYTSDHGELAGEHGMWWKNSWHEAAARVPWIFQLPEHRRGELNGACLDTPVSLADLLPTLAGLAGIAGISGGDGVDLSAAIRSGREPERGPVWYVNPMPRWGEGAEHVVVRDGRYKFVRFRGMAPNLLFDLDSDPFEQVNLVNNPAHAQALVRLSAVSESVWDFDAAEKQMKEDTALTESHKLEQRVGGNLYAMPAGRLLSVEKTTLYDKSAGLYEPERVIADWPTRVRGNSE